MLVYNSGAKINRRLFYVWINKIFNARDEERLKEFGPDRTCAEWILRNGGQVKFVNENEFLADYNRLPPEGTVFHLQEVDATESSIAHYGFIHFENCNYIQKVILHKCDYILDEALPKFLYLRGSITFLQISSCHNITNKGLDSLPNLDKLNTLLLYDLPYVKDKESVIRNLKNKFQNCDVIFK